MKFQVVLEPSDEGGYTAYVPALPGCISEGDTIDEAMANIILGQPDFGPAKRLPRMKKYTIKGISDEPTDDGE